MVRLILLVWWGLAAVSAAVPTEWERDMFCPDTHCLKPHPRPAGFSGSLGFFYDCCNPATGQISPLRSWGERVGLEARDRLLADGYRQVTKEASLCREGQCAVGGNHSTRMHGLYISTASVAASQMSI